MNLIFSISDVFLSVMLLMLELINNVKRNFIDNSSRIFSEPLSAQRIPLSVYFFSLKTLWLTKIPLYQAFYSNF